MLTITPLYISVPGEKCKTACAYCASRRYPLDQHSCLDEESPRYSLCHQSYISRMAFARDDAKCNALFIVGDCAPQNNRAFLERIAIINKQLHRPYRIIELTTSGKGLNKEYLYFLRSIADITTIDLNVAAFDDVYNQELAGMTEGDKVELSSLVKNIRDFTFNLHMHVYLSTHFDVYQSNPKQFFEDCKNKYGAQYLSIHYAPPADEWLVNKQTNKETYRILLDYIRKNGVSLENRVRTPNKDVYSWKDMIVILHEPSTAPTTPPNSLILKPDGHLYKQWDNKSSLIF